MGNYSNADFVSRLEQGKQRASVQPFKNKSSGDIETELTRRVKQAEKMLSKGKGTMKEVVAKGTSDLRRWIK